MSDISIDPKTYPQRARVIIPAYRRISVSVACPRCHCTAVHRSRRHGFDWIMSSIGFLPVRCFTCSRRFYTRQVPVDALP
jgi:hypothetical protein